MLGFDGMQTLNFMPRCLTGAGRSPKFSSTIRTDSCQDTVFGKGIFAGPGPITSRLRRFTMQVVVQILQVGRLHFRVSIEVKILTPSKFAQ
jgi:hypothetical protein